MEFSPFPPDEPESEFIELQSSGQGQADQEQTSNGTSGEPVGKKCMLEELLDDTFSSRCLDNSVTNKIVQAELNQSHCWR